MIQKSFVMMKPDAVQRRLMGKILSRFEEKGLQIVAVKLMQIDEELAKTLVILLKRLVTGVQRNAKIIMRQFQEYLKSKTNNFKMNNQCKSN